MKDKTNTLFFLKPLRSYRLRSQIIIFFSVTTLIILVLTIVILEQYKNLINIFFLDRAKKSFLISTHEVLTKSSIDFKEFNLHRQLFSINYQQTIIKQEKEVLVYQPTKIQAKLKPYLSTELNEKFKSKVQKFKDSWVCYSSYANENKSSINNANYNLYSSMISKSNEIIPLITTFQEFARTRLYYYAFEGSDQIMVIISPSGLDMVRFQINIIINRYTEMKADYNRKIQQYHNLEKIFDNFNLSKPFLNFAINLPQASFSMALLDINRDFQGVLGASMFFKDYENLNDILSNQTKSVLTTINGNIIISDFKVDPTLPFSIYNQSITGFNYDDWTQIKRFQTAQTNYQNNCAESQLYENSGLLCRVNFTSGLDTLIYVVNHTNNQLIIMQIFKKIFLKNSFYNANEVIQHHKDELNFFKKLIDQQIILNLAIFICVFILVVIIVLYLIGVILKPLEKIITFSNNTIQQENPKYFKHIPKLNFKDLFQKGPFMKLFVTMKQLINLNFRKFREINKIEQIQFPRKIQDIHLQNKKLLKLLVNYHIKEFSQFQKYLRNLIIFGHLDINLERKYENLFQQKQKFLQTLKKNN